jgi:hypothetical protein
VTPLESSGRVLEYLLCKHDDLSLKKKKRVRRLGEELSGRTLALSSIPSTAQKTKIRNCKSDSMKTGSSASSRVTSYVRMFNV